MNLHGARQYARWPPEISFCVVNTGGRELLMRCLDAVAAERRRLPAPSEVLVLDNASDDGSAEAVRARGEEIELVALAQRRGKAWADSELMRRARGRYCLLLNEDSELAARAPRRRSSARSSAIRGRPARSRR